MSTTLPDAEILRGFRGNEAERAAALATLYRLPGPGKRLQVVDLAGKMIFENEIPAGAARFEVPATGWPSGVFFVKIVGANGISCLYMGSYPTSGGNLYFAIHYREGSNGSEV